MTDRDALVARLRKQAADFYLDNPAVPLLREAADALSRETAISPYIDCPLCGVTVQQIASATLSLALWQHVNWSCAKRETAGTCATCATLTAERDALKVKVAELELDVEGLHDSIQYDSDR